MTQMSRQTIPGNHPVFETDLFVPEYREGNWNEWEIRKAALCFDHGYHSGIWLVDNLSVLLRNDNAGDSPPETWMSPSPHEIESQELGCRHAFGHTVIMGLGLGWVAVNAALNPEVDAVTVIEIDPDIIELTAELRILEQLPGKAAEKITVLEADALTWRPERPVDFLYADIWQKLGQRCALPQVRQMQDNVNARLIYFWGQELAVYNEMQKSPSPPALTSQSVSHCIRHQIGLPLLIPETPDYAAMIHRVIENRKKRHLPLERD